MQTAKRIAIHPSPIARKPVFSRTMIIHGAEFIDILPVHGIQHVKAESNYCRFVLQDGVSVMASRPLGYYEEHLTSCGFIRAHQSFIVNPSCVIRIRKVPGCCLCMQDATEIPVSRSRKKEIVEVLTSYHR